MRKQTEVQYHQIAPMCFLQSSAVTFASIERAHANYLFCFSSTDVIATKGMIFSSVEAVFVRGTPSSVSSASFLSAFTAFSIPLLYCSFHSIKHWTLTILSHRKCSGRLLVFVRFRALVRLLFSNHPSFCALHSTNIHRCACF